MVVDCGRLVTDAWRWIVGGRWWEVGVARVYLRCDVSSGNQY